MCHIWLLNLLFKIENIEFCAKNGKKITMSKIEIGVPT